MESRDVRIDTSISPGLGKTSHVKSASRALDIVETLASAPEGLGFGDLARLRHIPKSSLHALLAVLTERGYVELDARSRTYALGIRTWEVGQAFLSHRDLVRIAQPVMQRVVDEINETVQLAVLDGIENVYLAKVDCSHPVRLQSEVGKRLLAHATGLGKVLLARFTDSELIRRYQDVDFPALGPNTIHDLPELMRVIDVVRDRGFAIDDQEYTPGLRCVAVPILDIDHGVTAALSASIPVMRAGSGQLDHALRAIATASIDISRELGVSTSIERLDALTRWDGNVLATHRDETDRRE